MILSGKLIENTVMIHEKGVEELHRTSFYGRPRGNALELSLPESAYLIYANKIKVGFEGKELDFRQFFLKSSSLMKNFELYYIVYKALRERGFFVQPASMGFRVYPRGGHPGKTPSQFLVIVTSERIPLVLSELKKHIDTVNNLKKRLVLAIVDEDSDITFYEAKRTCPSGTCVMDINRSLTTASFLEDRCMIWDPPVSSKLHNEWFFGIPMDEGHLQLSLVESCYLMNKEIIEIENKNFKKLDFMQFSDIASKIESDFMIKYKVYENLRDSGLVPKTGFKFGTHFRVYRSFEKKVFFETKAEIKHSDYLVHAIEEDHIFFLQQLSRAVRLANSVRKEMIYAAAGSKIDFFVIGRIRI